MRLLQDAQVAHRLLFRVAVSILLLSRTSSFRNRRQFGDSGGGRTLAECVEAARYGVLLVLGLAKLDLEAMTPLKMEDKIHFENGVIARALHGRGRFSSISLLSPTA